MCLFEGEDEGVGDGEDEGGKWERGTGSGGRKALGAAGLGGAEVLRDLQSEEEVVTLEKRMRGRAVVGSMSGLFFVADVLARNTLAGLY